MGLDRVGSSLSPRSLGQALCAERDAQHSGNAPPLRVGDGQLGKRLRFVARTAGHESLGEQGAGVHGAARGTGAMGVRLPQVGHRVGDATLSAAHSGSRLEEQVARGGPFGREGPCGELALGGVGLAALDQRRHERGERELARRAQAGRLVEGQARAGVRLRFVEPATEERESRAQHEHRSGVGGRSPRLGGAGGGVQRAIDLVDALDALQDRQRGDGRGMARPLVLQQPAGRERALGQRGDLDRVRLRPDEAMEGQEGEQTPLRGGLAGGVVDTSGEAVGQPGDLPGRHVELHEGHARGLELEP